MSHSFIPLDVRELPARLRGFISCRNFMTDELLKLGDLQVDVISEQKMAIMTDQEKHWLNNDDNGDCYAFRRQVYLCVNQCRYIYGHVVIPRKTMDHLPEFGGIGKTSLGKRLKQWQARRGQLSFFYVKSKHLFYQQALVKERIFPERLLLRCSIFVIDCDYSLLVYEVVLPYLHNLLC